MPWRLATLSALLALVLGGCGAGEGGTGGRDGIRVQRRTIGVVSLGLSSPIGNAHAELIEAAGKELGWRVLVTDGAYDPATIGAAVQSYVDRQVDAIITESSEASSMRAGLLAAKRADIPVIASVGGVEPSDLFAAQYTEDETRLGTLGAKAILGLVPDPKVLDLKVSAASSGVARDEALKRTLPRDSIVDEEDVDLGNPVDSTQRGVDGALSKHPEIDAVYAVYDTLLQPVETTLRRARKAAAVVSYFATPDNLKRLRTSDNPLQAAVAVNAQKTGVIAIDQLVRHFQTGAPLDRDAVAKRPLDYTTLTKRNLTAKLRGREDLYPNREILAPFFKRWQHDYRGTG